MTSGRSPIADASRQCARTGLWLLATGGTEAYRIARPSYGPLNPRLRQVNPSSVAEWARWDVAGGRTIYAADTRVTAYREVLAYLAPAVGVRDTRLSEVFTDVARGPQTVLERIASEWDDLWSIEPRQIVRGWRDGRALYELELPPAGWVAAIEHQDSIDALNRGLAQELASMGISRLTRAHLCGDDRTLTTRVAQWVRRQTLDDGSLPHGIAFPSKHGSDTMCWAIWLRRVDDGHDPSSEPTKVHRTLEIGPPHNNTPLKAAADSFGLRIL